MNNSTENQDAAGFWRSVDENKKERQNCGGNGSGFRMTRRAFLKLAGAQVMMASLAGCMKPLEKIVPYVRSPEEIVPGKPLYYASALSSEGFARGILVETHTGRPTKIEGNPGHPDSRGATDAITQAAIYQLYDPERARTVTHGGLLSSFSEFIAALRSRLDNLKGNGGAGLRFLSRPIISPTLGYLRRQIQAQFPAARWHQYSPLHPDRSRQAMIDLYGSPLQPVYRLQEADVIFSIESDFLTAGPGAMAYSRAFAARRETRPGGINLNRLYAVESSPTLTGTVADHRLILHPSRTEAFAAGLLEMVTTGGSASAASLPAGEQRFLQALARDLQNNRSSSLVVAGPEQPVNIQVLAARLNEALRNNGNTVLYLPVIEEFPENNAASLAALVNDLNGGTVSDLVILDGNPVYASPAVLALAQACGKARFTAYLGLYYDETARIAQWHIPMADELESWGDARAFDGTVTVRQPVIAPLYNGVTDYEFCLAFLPGSHPPYEDVIRTYWRGKLTRTDFDAFWKQTLHDGVMPGSAFTPAVVTARGNVPSASPAAQRWTLQFRPDPHLLDGRFFHNSSLQELPKPLTKLTWGNAALIAPASAAQLKLKEGDLITITTETGSVDAPVYVLPGQADGVLTVHLGYGRKHAGHAGLLGFNAWALQSDTSPYETTGFSFSKKGKAATLATTQHHGVLSGARHLLLVADIAQYTSAPRFVRDLIHAPGRSETLYRPDEHLKGEYQWAMCIDLNRCTGCGACTIACQVENNIAVVGKKEVKRNREMHWIRVDRYFRGSPSGPEIHHQPVPCMHCEGAPCELVCPVEATSHSSEGLNEMTYNRCVGTRYCSNNCPYKVRRFNFFEYNHLSASQYQGKNPNVTIRSRGVMEKCTYCLQRISAARIAARRENRRISDGEVVPACAQACPTGAIVFGDLRDPSSQVNQAKANPLNYGMLEETGARPRTTYIAKIRNLNRELT